LMYVGAHLAPNPTLLLTIRLEIDPHKMDASAPNVPSLCANSLF
jgi:hypothetical protein